MFNMNITRIPEPFNVILNIYESLEIKKYINIKNNSKRSLFVHKKK